jgi:hypothetical protein
MGQEPPQAFLGVDVGRGKDHTVAVVAKVVDGVVQIADVMTPAIENVTQAFGQMTDAMVRVASTTQKLGDFLVSIPAEMLDPEPLPWDGWPLGPPEDE